MFRRPEVQFGCSHTTIILPAHQYALVRPRFVLAPGSEDRRQFLRRYNLELIEGAITRAFVVAPAAKLRRMPKPIALHVIVRDLYD